MAAVVPVVPAVPVPVAYAAPAKPYPIPGKIEAENFDTGVEGVAYLETTPDNNGLNLIYRPDAPSVDLEFCDGADKICSNNVDMNWIGAGEFFKYTVDANFDGMYKTTMHIGMAVAPLLAGQPVATIIAQEGVSCAKAKPVDCVKPAVGTVVMLKAIFPAAEATGYYDYKPITGPAAKLKKGPTCLTMCVLQGDFHFDYMEITGIAITPAPTAAATVPLTPMLTEAPADLTTQQNTAVDQNIPTTTTTANTSGGNTGSDGLSDWYIALIVIAVAFAIALIGAGLWRRRNAKIVRAHASVPSVRTVTGETLA